MFEISQDESQACWAINAHDSPSHMVHKSFMTTTSKSATLAKWLDEAIENAGTTQAAVGRAIGLSSQKINRMVQGTREMTAVELIELSAHLNAPIPSLSGKMPPQEASRHSSPTASDEKLSNFDKEAYNKAFAAALKIEEAEYGGEMPLSDFINMISIGLKNLSTRRN